ncbi:hypothetical protein GQF42_43960 [Streptomyces broussonetiae]|uniref:Uncharacterized protein n=1 Tax=Streptomyces broussonetiae TaxID=2686304 RepID=A0A6I6NCT7_9ACTN|nr:hypothetical protein GQF42_43960 [Streptomyces broussonetiae]
MAEGGASRVEVSRPWPPGGAVQVGSTAAHCQYAAQPTPDRPEAAIIATTAADRWIGEPVRVLDLNPGTWRPRGLIGASCPGRSSPRASA